MEKSLYPGPVILVFSLLAVGIGLAGVIYYENAKKHLAEIPPTTVPSSRF